MKNKQEKYFFSRTSGLVILAGAVLIIIWGLWTVPLMGINEGRRAVTVQEMIRHGNWLIPTMNGQIYINKPPLFYWLMLFTTKIFHSTAEWVLRLPSALAALTTCGLLFRSVKKYINRDTAILAILILATSLTFTRRAHWAEIEMLLTFFCVASNLFFYDYYLSGKTLFLWVSYLCMGLAILTKGPVALVFYLPPLMAFGLLKRSVKIRHGLLFWPGWIVMLIVGGTWYVVIWFSKAGPLLRQVINVDLVGKTMGGLSGRKPFYTYILNLLGIFAPWTLLPILRAKKIKALFTSPATIYFTLQAIIPLAIMSLIASKHNKYILPLLPAMATCLAVYLLDFCNWLAAHYQKKGRKYFTIFAFSLLAGYFIFYVALEPRVYRYRYSAFKPLLVKLKQVRGQAPLYCLSKVHFIQLIFYYGQPIPEITAAQLKKMVDEKRPFLLLAESHSWSLLPKQGLKVLLKLECYRKRNRAVKLLSNFSSGNIRKPYKTISYPGSPTLYSKLEEKLLEDSGLIFFDAHVWTFNDSNGEPAIYQIDKRNGKISQTVILQNAKNHDWEDITQDKEYIYVGDFGNNRGNRNNLKIYKICKKDIDKEKICKVKAAVINFSYNDRGDDCINRYIDHNCESLISLNDSLIIFTKTPWGESKMYRMPKMPGSYQLDPIVTLAADGMITGADFNGNMDELVLIGYNNGLPFIFLIPGFHGQGFSPEKIRRINLVGFKGAYTEGICWVNNQTLLISNEQNKIFKQAVYQLNIRRALKSKTD